MKDLAEKKNEDLENVRKKIDELVGYAWERGYKCGQADCEKPIEEKHEFCVGDVVHTKLDSKEGIVLGITKTGNQLWASVYYIEGFDVPQMLPMENLTYTGKHIDIADIFEQLFNYIKGDKENDRS